MPAPPPRQSPVHSRCTSNLLVRPTMVFKFYSAWQLFKRSCASLFPCFCVMGPEAFFGCCVHTWVVINPYLLCFRVRTPPVYRFPQILQRMCACFLTFFTLLTPSLNHPLKQQPTEKSASVFLHLSCSLL